MNCSAIIEQSKGVLVPLQKETEKKKCSVAPLLADIKDKDSLRFTDEDKANILQKRFSSVFTKEPEGTIPTITKRTNSVISELRVTEEMVRLHLSKINVNKSCGPDEVHPRMLFELANIIAEPVAFLFNLICEQEILPKDRRSAVACRRSAVVKRVEHISIIVSVNI